MLAASLVLAIALTAGDAPAAAAVAAEEGRLLVEQKCAKCHDVSLALSSELTDAGWKLHMKRMASRPGAAITDEQAHKIHEALKATAGRLSSR